MQYRFNDIICIDNFYEDPDEVRNFALSSNCFYRRTINEGYPGVRNRGFGSKSTPKSFSDINQYVMYKKYYTNFLNTLKKKCSLFDPDKITFREVSFHKTPLFSKDNYSKLNSGFIHTDNQDFKIKDLNKKCFAGVVYLNKQVCNPNSGTTIFKLKKSTERDIKFFNPINSFLFHNLRFRKYNEDDFISSKDIFWEYQKLYNTFLKKEKHFEKYLYYKNIFDSEFEPIKSFENVYNRIVIYSSDYFHTATGAFVNDFEDRLTQVFFAIEE
jgi:hypothetical protein